LHLEPPTDNAQARQPSATWSEALAGDPARVVQAQFGLESRPSQVLQPGWRMVGRARVPGTGARLLLDHGVLEHSGERAGCELVARVRIESGEQFERRFALDAGARWSASTVEVPRDAAGVLELELAIAAPPSSYVLVGIPAPVLHVPERSPRTVVLVTSDTHRADHVEGALRAVAIETPALRELAQRGVTYSDCWSSINITVPSHVALLSGLHPRDSGITDNQTTFADAPLTLPEVFRDAGWHTFAVTSINLLAPAASGLGQGFERTIAPLETRSASKAVDSALRLLEAAPERSVFFWLHVFDAHGPYQPDPPFDRKFYAGRDPRDPSIEPEPGMRVPPYLPGVRDAEFVRALYRGEIAGQDQELARLFAHPRLRDATIAFTADHGEVLGAHGIWWAHKDVYPDTLHVPLVLAWPDAQAGARVDLPVQNVDIARTLLDLAGFEAQAFPGSNLTRLDALDPTRPRFALSGARTSASITRGGWHLILQLRLGDEPEQKTHRALHEVELFDLRSDPGAALNQFQAQPSKARELRAELLAWLAHWKGERFSAFKRVDAATVANLQALGYASDTNDDDARAPLFDARCACEWCARMH
jgi:arylsulfatase A-like enzyme